MQDKGRKGDKAAGDTSGPSGASGASPGVCDLADLSLQLDTDTPGGDGHMRQVSDRARESGWSKAAVEASFALIPPTQSAASSKKNNTGADEAVREVSALALLCRATAMAAMQSSKETEGTDGNERVVRRSTHSCGPYALASMDDRALALQRQYLSLGDSEKYATKQQDAGDRRMMEEITLGREAVEEEVEMLKVSTWT